jgi:probable HAF family extracellular repeat protein
MSAVVNLTSQFVNSLNALYATTAFATEDGNNIANEEKFSYAGGSSSYSFGLYQYDVGANSLAQEFLLANGFSQTQIDELSQKRRLNRVILGPLNKQLKALLSTQNGIIALDQLDTTWFTDDIEPAAQMLLTSALAADPQIAAQIYSSPVAIQHVLDLVNQFSRRTQRYFANFLSGASVHIPKGAAVTWNPQLSDDANIQAFILATPYGISHPTSELNRENAFQAAIADEIITPTQIEVSAGTGDDSMSAMLPGLQNVTAIIDAGLTVSTGTNAGGNTFFLGNGSAVSTDSLNSDIFTSGTGSLALSGNCSVSCSITGNVVAFTVSITSSVPAPSVVDVVSNTQGTLTPTVYTFTGPDETLKIDDPATFTDTISGFSAAGCTIDLAGIGTAASARLGAGDILTVTGAPEGTISLQLAPAGNMQLETASTEVFSVRSDGDGGTDVSFGAPLPVTDVDFPGATVAGTYGSGVNETGEVAGTYFEETSTSDAYHGFLDNNGAFTAINDSLSGYDTIVSGINDSGEVVGEYDIRYNGILYHIYDGFMYDNGTFTAINPPGSNDTIVNGINDSGEIVGGEYSTDSEDGFLYDNGTFTAISVPGGFGTEAYGINNLGEVVGIDYTSSDYPNGFLYDEGTFTAINVPGATQTTPYGVNDAGQIVGSYAVGTSGFSFLYSNGTFTTINVPGASQTFVYGINDLGEVTGSYIEPSGIGHGFVASISSLSATPIADTLANFQNITGSTYADTLTAGYDGGVLTGNGGADTYVLAATGDDIVRDTAAHLNGSIVNNFSSLDQIDATTIAFGARTTLGFSEDASGTFGTLTVSDGAHTAALELLGQYNAAGFSTQSDGASGTLVTYSQSQQAMEALTLAASHA